MENEGAFERRKPSLMLKPPNQLGFIVDIRESNPISQFSEVEIGNDGRVVSIILHGILMGLCTRSSKIGLHLRLVFKNDEHKIMERIFKSLGGCLFVTLISYTMVESGWAPKLACTPASPLATPN